MMLFFMLCAMFFMLVFSIGASVILITCLLMLMLMSIPLFFSWSAFFAPYLLILLGIVFVGCMLLKHRGVAKEWIAIWCVACLLSPIIFSDDIFFDFFCFYPNLQQVLVMSALFVAFVILFYRAKNNGE